MISWPLTETNWSSGFDSSFCSGTGGIDAVGHQSAIVLNPPHAVVGNRRVAFFLEIEAGKDHRSHCQKEQQDGYKTGLAFPIHEFRYWPRTLRRLWRRGRHIPVIVNEQLRCHVNPHSWNC